MPDMPDMPQICLRYASPDMPPDMPQICNMYGVPRYAPEKIAHSECDISKNSRKAGGQSEPSNTIAVVL
ncbi:MAG: hypothetical protein FVQ84_07985 [Planctomycetes bacterium]|nr:hypothetical protein [Planctomycetota bacterium]